MEAIFATDWIGFFLMGFGILFLFGELLVNMRGLFALLGITSIVLYFYTYSPNPTILTIMLIIFFFSLLLIIIDGKIINDGTLAVLGLIGIIVSVSITAPNLYAGLYGVIGVLFGAAASFSFLKVFQSRNMWAKIALKDRLTTEEGYTSLNLEFEALLGEEGMTVTDLRPVGTIEINDKEYSAISNAQWIKKGTQITVSEVDGTKILVTVI